MGGASRLRVGHDYEIQGTEPLLFTPEKLARYAFDSVANHGLTRDLPRDRKAETEMI